MQQIIVGMADCRVGSVPGMLLTTHALGSCIGLVVHDPATGVGGILHFMLPDSTMNPERGRQNPYVFADTGIPLLLKQLIHRGAFPRKIVVSEFGGAQILDEDGIFGIGILNHLAARKILWKSGILLRRVAVGGSASRSVRLEIGSGRIWLLETDFSKKATGSGAEKGTETWRIVS
jgi:chemotaxis protein CheD